MVESRVGAGTAFHFLLPVNAEQPHEPDPDPRRRQGGPELLRGAPHPDRAASRSRRWATARSAFETLAPRDFNLLLLDMDMPEVTGMEVLRHVRRAPPGASSSIVITGVGDVELAVEAMKLGAARLPVQAGGLGPAHRLHRPGARAGARARSSARIEARARARAARQGGAEGLRHAGPDAAPRPSRSVEQIAQSDNNVLISGRERHRQGARGAGHPPPSRRADEPFVAVNCGGAHGRPCSSASSSATSAAPSPGADARRTGSFEEADGGTLFLDEVGDIALAGAGEAAAGPAGAASLRGSARPRSAAPTCASSPPPTRTSTRGRGGRFRDDLYYRLNVVAFCCRRSAPARATSRCSPTTSSTALPPNGKNDHRPSPSR